MIERVFNLNLDFDNITGDEQWYYDKEKDIKWFVNKRGHVHFYKLELKKNSFRYVIAHYRITKVGNNKGKIRKIGELFENRSKEEIFIRFDAMGQSAQRLKNI